MTIILAFVLLSIIFTIMSVGILLGRKPIAGSCGGVGAALGEKDYNCDICGGDPKRCEQQQDLKIQDQQIKEGGGLTYDATKTRYR